jgi:hypothetical protein
VRVARPQVLRDRSSALAGQQVVGSRRSDVVGAAPDVDAPDAVARGRGIDRGTGGGREHRAPERKAHDDLGHQRFARVLGPIAVRCAGGSGAWGPAITKVSPGLSDCAMTASEPRWNRLALQPLLHALDRRPASSA